MSKWIDFSIDERRAMIQAVSQAKPAYKADYNEMKESFIYGQPLNFGELIEKIKILQELFRNSVS